jgi:AraC-like DNA-binding protein
MPANEKTIRSMLISSQLSLKDTAWIEPLCTLIPMLPVMSYAVFGRYVMLVHNVLTGDQLGMEALNRDAKIQEKEQPYEINQRNRIDVYQSEQALLDVVRRGDINYHQVLNRSSSLSPGVPVQSRDPLRQIKTSIVVFTTLVTRAAMEGGLSPEIAYPLGDSYIQTAEDCRDSGELNSLAHAMYHDFIYRVHQLRANPHCSHAIQKCCDYIELSLDRKIRAKDLAVLVGYTEYYLTEKFKNETGLSVSDYVCNAKIKRAKMLLQSTDLSVSEIADRLAFNSANYLVRVFKELEDCTPAAFREKLKAEPH